MGSPDSMIFSIEGVPIYFPYEAVYPEQLEYMKTVISTISGSGHALIEMPCGTGKTIALLASVLSYQLHCRQRDAPFKVVYCSRTVSEIDKTLLELKALVAYIGTENQQAVSSYLGIGLSSRQNMCVNEQAQCSKDVDLACRKMVNRLEGLKCDFYENTRAEILPGIYTFDEIKKYSSERGMCPYYLVRECLDSADCIVYSYNYLLDPAIHPVVSKGLPQNTVVIFDEAHNIDAYCIEALSLRLDRNMLEASVRLASAIEKRLKELRDIAEPEDAQHQESAQGPGNPLRLRETITEAIENAIPYFYSDTKYGPIPGNIRNSSHFTSILRRFIEFLKSKLKTTHLTSESPSSFIQSIYNLTFIQQRTLRFFSQRLAILVTSLGLEDDELWKLRRVADFATMLSIYSRGFVVLFEPFDTLSSVFNPILRLYCMDASIAISHVFRSYKNVLITSGTLSPLDMYPRMLNFLPVSMREISATLERNLICPMVIIKGNDQMLMKSDASRGIPQPPDIVSENPDPTKMTTSFSTRNDTSVVRNYGSLLINFSMTVPDNIVCFFPSYIYMEEMVTLWSETGIISEILKNKLLFIETPDPRETALALENFRNACDNGRGAIFLGVARGKVSEGVDFEDGYARAVIMLGVPFVYTESPSLRERLRFLREEYDIREYDFLVFDAMRHAAQCLGRGFRKKSDYSLMVMADHRYTQQNIFGKMPRWVRDRLEKGNTGLSIDMAVNIAKAFFREMAQPFEGANGSLLSREEVEKHLGSVRP